MRAPDHGRVPVPIFFICVFQGRHETRDRVRQKAMERTRHSSGQDTYIAASDGKVLGCAVAPRHSIIVRPLCRTIVSGIEAGISEIALAPHTWRLSNNPTKELGQTRPVR